ncbi:MAG TPA: hypothetical protein PK156_12660 [Polyangium sp.]|nr:hypothetical protein [Polyangium sp.]
MRWMESIMAALVISSGASLAWAWDGPQQWFESASAKNPGGGGIIGTGGAMDHNLMCAHCHVEASNQIDLKFDFTPPLEMVGGQPVYAPGQTYQVAVNLVGEHLGTSGCGQYLAHTNNFAATVENGSGKVAGMLRSDAGQTSASCPQTMPDPKLGSTLLYGDCHAIVSSGEQNVTSWSFSWQAPDAGAGSVTLYYGAVDGNCDMMSMGDDVKMGNMKIGEAMAALSPEQKSLAPRFAWIAVLPLGLGAAMQRRRHARRTK